MHEALCRPTAQTDSRLAKNDFCPESTRRELEAGYRGEFAQARRWAYAGTLINNSTIRTKIILRCSLSEDNDAIYTSGLDADG